MNMRPELTSGHSAARPSTTATPAHPRSNGSFLSHRSGYRATGESVSLRSAGDSRKDIAPPPIPPAGSEPIRYQSSYDNEVRFWNRLVGAWVLGVLATIGLFLALPFFQLISTVSGPSTELVSIDLSKAPPPPPPEQKAPPPEEEKQAEDPELKQDQPMLTLAQLELALNPGMGDAASGGDFSIDFQVNAMEELEMIFEISEVDRIPRAIYRVAPVYPYEMKQAGISGSVDLLFVCTAEGKVRRVAVRSSTHREFQEASVRAVRDWRFEPGMKDGQPVNVRMLIPFHFNVHN